MAAGAFDSSEASATGRMDAAAAAIRSANDLAGPGALAGIARPDSLRSERDVLFFTPFVVPFERRPVLEGRDVEYDVGSASGCESSTGMTTARVIRVLVPF